MLSLILRLPTDSLTSALVAGGRQFFGWDEQTFILANLYDATNLGTQATGNWKKPPKFELHPRPKAQAPIKKDPSKRTTSVANLHAKFLSGK